MNRAFVDYFRCPESFINFAPLENQTSTVKQGYFKFGPDAICYGRSPLAAESLAAQLTDAMASVQIDGNVCRLPFSPTEIADNLRLEYYEKKADKSLTNRAIRELYYALRPAFPVSFRRHLQRIWLRDWSTKPFPRWPVDRSVDQMLEKLMYLTIQSNPGIEIPFIWFWPEGRSSCAIMTHDVETAVGLAFTSQLMDINDSFSIKSSFQLIPDARYAVTPKILAAIKTRGFEVNVHDLKHDGHLYDSHDKFRQAALRIDAFIERFESKGFRSGALYRNQEWYNEFRFSYDMSVPNVAHLDPQRGGCCTVMPYFVGDVLEIPVTMTQDHTLFNVLETYSLDLWREQMALIMKQHGLASFIIHPDYIQTTESRNAYFELLAHLCENRDNVGVWIALPGEVNTWWRQRSAMHLIQKGEQWQIEGEGADRAQIAYATISNDILSYRLAGVC
jgi:hypothetical protein